MEHNEIIRKEFAKQAEKEGYSQVAKLFRAAAEAETIHAHNHLRTLGGINTTAENLQEAIEGETHDGHHLQLPAKGDTRRTCASAWQQGMCPLRGHGTRTASGWAVS